MTAGLIITIIALGITLFIVLNQYKKSKRKLSTEIENKNEENNKLNSDLERYSGIISIENEIESKNKEFSEIQTDATELNDKFINAKSIFKELEKDIKIYQNDLEFVELGIYEPIFDLESSEKYKERITQIITRQKQLIKGGNACVCNTEWTVGNSRKQGEIMTRRYINLTLRAFNGECDSLISKVRWNNIKRFEERISKAFTAINKLGKSNNTFITDKYLKLKLDELHLVYELAHKKYQ
jgi:chromosome segregation ATPase